MLSGALYLSARAVRASGHRPADGGAIALPQLLCRHGAAGCSADIDSGSAERCVRQRPAGRDTQPSVVYVWLDSYALKRGRTP